ncbi:signal peptidase II [Algicella marina]|uniref:Lipoprotein signal peptidase n=1 Tax=Algicella marina TaxID=2683284 RepID=A0A6P1T2R3_9RHOB|nr:signal peptidase II [Algicella marina]QHQ35953.1 signal peptidase II [Algicella marina]
MKRLWITAIAIFLVDRLTKLVVVEWLDLRSLADIEVVPPFLNFVMAWNRGVNFGIGASGSDLMRWGLIALAVVICTGVIWWFRRAEGWLVPVSAGMLVGGAIGNVWDRVQYGAVADFLNMSCCGIDNPYSFNVADVAIFVGALGLIFFTGKDAE